MSLPSAPRTLPPLPSSASPARRLRYRATTTPAPQAHTSGPPRVSILAVSCGAGRRLGLRLTAGGAVHAEDAQEDGGGDFLIGFARVFFRIHLPRASRYRPVTAMCLVTSSSRVGARGLRGRRVCSGLLPPSRAVAGWCGTVSRRRMPDALLGAPAQILSGQREQTRRLRAVR
ncbi:hypothetical protein FB451DRAFT_1416633 [Mycena latifolia]|nr:hypothetical protein FB451DRAFT_1420477 [Mycena latifolia]KAJ7437730.1 hypothetical protein FB451DRAFT_1416633 [Mycena latifolia]